MDASSASTFPGFFTVQKSAIQAGLNQALLTAEMFVAFSKKSPCRSLAPGFSQGITEMTTNGSFDTMLQDATSAWEAAQKH